MLAREKAVLGFYITKHPLAQHEQLLAACASATTTDLARLADDTQVIVGGMVSSLRTVVAKGGRNPGKAMGIVTLEDLAGRVEGILFPKQLPAYRAVLVPDAVVFLEGAVDRKREEPSLRVSRVVTADEATVSFAKALLVTIRADSPIDELAALLRVYPGDCNVYLNVETTDGLTAQLQCHPSIRVCCNERFVGDLVGLMGRESVCILGTARRPLPLPPGRPARQSSLIA